MKKSALVMLALALVVFGTVPVEAGNRSQGGRAGITPGSCVSVGDEPTPITLEGVVIDAAVAGGGLVIDVDGMLETVYVLGPTWYWYAEEMEKPEVGEYLVVDGLVMELGGNPVTVAVAITVGEQTILALIQPQGAVLSGIARRRES